MRPSTRHNRDIYAWAILSSLLLSAVAVALGITPNDDAFVYLRTAELVVDEGLGAAFARYPWASYSLLIATLQRLPGLDYFAAAQLLNALLYVLTTVSFMLLVGHISRLQKAPGAAATRPASRPTANSERRLLTLAAMVILAYPHINEFRFHLIRDIGMLGFVLLGLWQLLCYRETLRRAAALGFSLALLAATLFRGEAFLFLLLMPLTLCFDTTRTWRQRFRAVCLPYFLVTALALLGALVLWLAGINLLQQAVTNFSVYLPFLQQAMSSLRADDPALVAALFSDHAAQFSSHHLPLIVSAGMSALLAATVIESLGLIVLGVLLYGARRASSELPAGMRAPFFGQLLIALLIMLAFVLVTRFTTTRYTMVFCTTLLVLLPFIIDHAWRQAVLRRQLRRFAPLALLLFTYSVMDAHISYGEPRTHSDQAMQWLDEHAADAPIMTNKSYIAWLSRQIPDYDRVEHELSVADFLAAEAGTLLVIERDEQLYAALLEAESSGLLVLRHQIDDRRGARILVFERLP